MQAHRELIVEPIGLEVETLPRPIVWRELFGNDHPVELEIGMGKGTFLTEQAKARPEVNFFGIEWANWFWRYASDRLRRNECHNVRTIRTEHAARLLETRFTHALSPSHLFTAALDAKEFAEKLPSRLNRLFDSIAQGQITLAQANALLVRPENEPPVAKGTLVRVLEI